MFNQDHTVLYTGVTNDLQRRVFEHRSGKGGVFTNKYKIYKLVYYESGDEITMAISREKQIKGGSRQKKVDLINSINPDGMICMIYILVNHLKLRRMVDFYDG